MITISKEEYFRLRVASEENDRFFDWDLSENWSDYDRALNPPPDANNDGDILPIDEWKENLRKELFEVS